MSLLPFFEWCENADLIVAMRSSLWLFPAIESLHLLGLAMIGGALLVVDLRLLGFGLRRQPVATLARDAAPWLLGSLGVMLPTGVLLFMSSAVKCYYLPVFWLKMATLLTALAFTFSIRRRVAMAVETGVHPGRARVVGSASISLWLIVAIAGRFVGLP